MSIPVSVFLYEGQISLWLWFTVYFANFAEAMAEGRGKAQADALRRSRQETIARIELSKGKHELIPATQRKKRQYSEGRSR